MGGETLITPEALQMVAQDTFSKYLLESSNLLSSIKHFLKGEEMVIKTKTENGESLVYEAWESNPKKIPPINEKGYNYIIKNLSPLMDKATATGNISEMDANLLVRFAVNTLSEGLVIKYSEFGLTNENDIDSIIEPILALLKIHISKSIDMGLVKEIFRTHQISEIRNYENKNEQRPSLSL